ncbi:hypothetical protein [Riemerella columbipharyngis]|uniref:Uncharacterized protein n=1 Tax=Riemerella columbipharyngis TaxID=1071918 RepID=A0A1G7BSH2_9FLAO|nr:hypothetical protein [Riemerella columbipharyngis]SDE30094.1 hypothetical protein SAMN05421544_106108 [Riemerella columbipharyngis]
MKKQLIVYAILILAFFAYNLFFQVKDYKISTAINILFGSFLFLYIAYIAYVILRKLKK